MSRSTTAPRLAAGAALLAATFAVSACGSASGAPTASGDDHEQEPGAAEAAAPTPRVALTYEGGILVLDAASLQVVADLDLEGFNRLNGAGDGRHLLVSTKGGSPRSTWAPGARTTATTPTTTRRSRSSTVSSSRPSTRVTSSCTTGSPRCSTTRQAA